MATLFKATTAEANFFDSLCSCPKGGMAKTGSVKEAANLNVPDILSAPSDIFRVGPEHLGRSLSLAEQKALHQLSNPTSSQRMALALQGALVGAKQRAPAYALAGGGLGATAGALGGGPQGALGGGALGALIGAPVGAVSGARAGAQAAPVLARNEFFQRLIDDDLLKQRQAQEALELAATKAREVELARQQAMSSAYQGADDAVAALRRAGSSISRAMPGIGRYGAMAAGAGAGLGGAALLAKLLLGSGDNKTASVKKADIGPALGLSSLAQPFLYGLAPQLMAPVAAAGLVGHLFRRVGQGNAGAPAVPAAPQVPAGAAGAAAGAGEALEEAAKKGLGEAAESGSLANAFRALPGWAKGLGAGLGAYGAYKLWNGMGSGESPRRDNNSVTLSFPKSGSVKTAREPGESQPSSSGYESKATANPKDRDTRPSRRDLGARQQRRTQRAAADENSLARRFSSAVGQNTRQAPASGLAQQLLGMFHPSMSTPARLQPGVESSRERAQGSLGGKGTGNPQDPRIYAAARQQEQAGLQASMGQDRGLADAAAAESRGNVQSRTARETDMLRSVGERMTGDRSGAPDVFSMLRQQMRHARRTGQIPWEATGDPTLDAYNYMSDSRMQLTPSGLPRPQTAGVMDADVVKMIRAQLEAAGIPWRRYGSQ